MFEIMKAEQNDLPAILALQKRAYQSEAELVEDCEIPPLTQTMGGLTEDFNNGIILKAVCENDTIVGSVRVRVMKNTSCIGRLMVSPAFQNQGIGTALLSSAEKSHPSERFELFTSDLSAKNLSLYIKNGYEIFKRERLSEKVNFVFLEKHMNSYTFQLASHGEIAEIVSIYHSLVGTPGCTWDLDYPSKGSAQYDINKSWLYTLKRHGNIIAVASAGDFDELSDLPWKLKNPCELMRIGVSPTFQKRGIGTLLLQNVIRRAQEKGYDGIRLLVSKTNPAALALYEKTGFERCGEVFRYDKDFYCCQKLL